MKKYLEGLCFEYSYNTPISGRLADRKRIDETYKYLYEHNIVADPFKIIKGMSKQVGEEVTPKEVYDNVCQDLRLIEIYSDMVKDKYQDLKFLTFNESQIVCAFFLALNMDKDEDRELALELSPWCKIDDRYLTNEEMLNYLTAIDREYTTRANKATY